MNRSSSAEWSGSARRSSYSSAKTVAASSKETPCFLLFSAFFVASHSIFVGIIFTVYLQCHYSATDISSVFAPRSGHAAGPPQFTQPCPQLHALCWRVIL